MANEFIEINGIKYEVHDNTKSLKEHNPKNLCKKCRDEQEELMKEDSADILTEQDENIEDDEEPTNERSEIPPCENDESATCPYGPELSCENCKSMSGKQRDTLQEMSEVRAKQSLPDITETRKLIKERL
jgi:hypothetical protein